MPYLKTDSHWFYLAGYIFGFGIGVAVLFSFLYLMLLRIPGLLTLVIWTIIISLFVLFLIGSILLYSLAKKYHNDKHTSDAEVRLMYACSYIGFVVTALYACLMVVLMRRIALAIGIVKEAARAVGKIPFLILLPIVEVVGVVLFLIPWVIYVICLATSGKNETKDYYGLKYNQYVYDKNTKWAFLYMLFCWFWTSQFIIAIGQLVIALSVTAFYFTHDKSSIGNSTAFWVRRWPFGSAVLAAAQSFR